MQRLNMDFGDSTPDESRNFQPAIFEN